MMEINLKPSIRVSIVLLRPIVKDFNIPWITRPM